MGNDHHFSASRPKRCLHCRKAWWRHQEACELEDDDMARMAPVVSEAADIALFPIDPEDLKQQRIAAHLERTGLADVKMSGARARALLEQLGREYDEDPSRFLSIGEAN